MKSANMSFDMIHFLKDTFLGFEGLFQTLPPSHVSFPYSFAVFINILQLASLALVVCPMTCLSTMVFSSDHEILLQLISISVSQVSPLIFSHSEFELVKITAFLFRIFLKSLPCFNDMSNTSPLRIPIHQKQ